MLPWLLLDILPLLCLNLGMTRPEILRKSSSRPFAQRSDLKGFFQGLNSKWNCWLERRNRTVPVQPGPSGRRKMPAYGAAAVIPSKSNRKNPRDHDEEMRKWRHRIENCFAKIKGFRAIATRCDMTAAGFRALINLVASVIAAR